MKKKKNFLVFGTLNRRGIITPLMIKLQEKHFPKPEEINAIIRDQGYDIWEFYISGITKVNLKDFDKWKEINIRHWRVPTERKEEDSILLKDEKTKPKEELTKLFNERVSNPIDVERLIIDVLRCLSTDETKGIIDEIVEYYEYGDY